MVQYRDVVHGTANPDVALTRPSKVNPTAWRRHAIRGIDTVLAHLPGQRRTVVILGFWRSGTTFVLERVASATGFRSFFEPLHYSVPQAAAMHFPPVFEVDGTPTTEWIPFEHPAEPAEDLKGLMSAALLGSLSTGWTQRNRQVSESFSRSTVVKFVRANLLGAWIQKTFNVRPILVVRHPGAVLASIMREEGGAPGLRVTLGDPRLLTWVLEQDGIRRHWPELTKLTPTRGSALTDEDTILRLWVVAHWIPWRLAESGEWRPLVLPYHRIVNDPDAFSLLLDQQELRRTSGARTGRSGDSSTTKRARRGASARTRIHGWRKELPGTTRRSLEKLIRSFGERFESWIESWTP